MLAGGVIAPLDYGMFGQLDGRTRERIADLLIGLLAQDTDRVIRALEALDIRGEPLDARGFRRDLGRAGRLVFRADLDTIDLGPLLRELIGFVRAHHLHIPPDLVLLIRSLVTIESVGRSLDPHFDIARQLSPFSATWRCGGSIPTGSSSQTLRTTEDLQRIATLLPDLLSQSLDSIKRGEMRVHFDLQGFEPAGPPAHPGQQHAGRRHRHRRPVRRLVAGPARGAASAGLHRLHRRRDPLPVAGLEHVARMSGGFPEGRAAGTGTTVAAGTPSPPFGGPDRRSGAVKESIEKRL